ncbi:MAG: type II toxin-antitoxin system prevent-host-death family antitoxin [Actinomycetota bacterium]|nr:type II toxin-antitoxin system prevent-host-death family antitoxin [Actinomycetota bacterium]
MEVGVRELRNNLSRYLERVRGGEEVVVTDRARPIARVLQMSGERAIDRLVREGKVTPAKTRTRSRPTPVKTAGTVSDLIAEQRR